MLTAGDMNQPVKVARTLMKYGHSLRKAHEAVTRLAEGRTVATELHATDARAPVADLARLGVTARPVRVPEVDVRAVRERFGLSQAEFAIRFGFALDTVQNWEQGRNRPDAPTQLLLKVIEEYPEAVERVLAGEGAGNL
jgi:DNA-binding transcriptional regulator YiaG